MDLFIGRSTRNAENSKTNTQVQHDSRSTAIKVFALMYLICLDLIGEFLQVRLRLLSLMSVSFPRLRLQLLCAVMRLWERSRGDLWTMCGFDCLMLPGCA